MKRKGAEGDRGGTFGGRIGLCRHKWMEFVGLGATSAWDILLVAGHHLYHKLSSGK